MIQTGTGPLRGMMDRLQTIYDDYPRQFWLLIGASFIDMVGNALIFPFFALFLTDRFDVSVARVGVIFAIFSAAGMLGSTIGGALTDKFGRKPIALAALVLSASGNLAIAFATEFWMLYLIAGTVGVIGSIGGPAWQAMMADLLPEEKRAEGFGLIRILFNVAVMFGPMIGGLLAGISYVLLFSVDAATSLITATILFFTLKETKPERQPSPEGEADPAEESIGQVFRGYAHVFRDRLFITFALVGMLVWLVYFQMNSTLSVYLRDEHGIAPQGFGLLLAMNATLVVTCQFIVTRWLRNRGFPSMLVLASGTLLYAIGFSMYGFVATGALFAMAMVVITMGEMLVAPVGYALASKMAPDHMRGRYMAIFGFSGAIASGSGTWLAGQVMNLLGPDWVWYLGGVVALVATAAYVWLHQYINVPAVEREAKPAPVQESESLESAPNLRPDIEPVLDVVG